MPELSPENRARAFLEKRGELDKVGFDPKANAPEKGITFSGLTGFLIAVIMILVVVLLATSILKTG